jgi:hypothetical protein
MPLGETPGCGKERFPGGGMVTTGVVAGGVTGTICHGSLVGSLGGPYIGSVELWHDDSSVGW